MSFLPLVSSMTPHPLRPVSRPLADAVPDLSVTDLMTRAVAGLYEGLMPGARLEALLDRMETRR